MEDPIEMEKNYQSNLAYLKDKIEAGGEVIVTQVTLNLNYLNYLQASWRPRVIS